MKSFATKQRNGFWSSTIFAELSIVDILGILAKPLAFCYSIRKDKIPTNAKIRFFMKFCSLVNLRHNMAFRKLLQKGIQKLDLFYSLFKVLRSHTFFWPGYFAFSYQKCLKC